MQNPAHFDDEIYGFHVQQAVEKCFKAWLAHVGIEYPFTHDLRRLYQLLAGNGFDAAPYRPLIRMTAFAVQFRYDATGDDSAGLDRAFLLGETTKHFERVRGDLQDA
jgi:hypothetical protein